ncbi:YkgJ family cysteine cluster protein [Candidatus Electronema sp. JC]|uniref:YkgJ family cysteine cluster protein n=1 Tax=Candidatus Electronema sp. JC TaxID=3401570 RepID=UPI003B43924E
MTSDAAFPYEFDNAVCAACGGRCCRGAGGYVWVSREELEAMAAMRGMNAGLFAKQYARRTQGKISLQERVISGEHFCCFFDRAARRCLIYECRPAQCRSFPFWERFKTDQQELLRECPGVRLTGPQADRLDGRATAGAFCKSVSLSLSGRSEKT